MRKSVIIACLGIVVLFVMLFALAGCGGGSKDQTQTEINKMFFEAAEKGDLNGVQKALDAGADLFYENKYGTPPIYMAAANGHTKTVALLIDKGLDPDSGRKNGMSLLQEAARNGHIETVTLLLDRGADVNGQTKDGLTPLDVAEKEGHTEIANLIKQRGGMTKDQLAASAPSAPVPTTEVTTTAASDQGYQDGFDKGLYVYQHMAEEDLETAARPPTGPYETQEEQNAYKDGWEKGYSEGLDKGADIENATP